VADGYSASMGARELRRAVMRLVDDELSDALLTGRVRCCPLSLLASAAAARV
jgi:ATP-dependent Clp protease ATP-binding subunit ClpA